MENQEFTLNLNEDAVRIVLSLIQHALMSGGAIQIGDLNTMNNFTNACIAFLQEVENGKNIVNEETLVVEDSE